MSHAASLNEAFAHHQAGRAAEAERLYRQLLAGRPDDPDVLHLLGVLCLQTGRAPQAVELMARALEIRPQHAETANHLGAAYGALERFDDAVAVLRRAAQLSPQDGSIHYNLGTALRSAGRLADAVTSLRHAVAANPNYAEAHYNLANTLRELKRFEEAEAAYREALRVRPGYLKALVNLGAVLRDQRRYPEAAETLERAVATDPNYASAHLNLGTVLRDSGRFAEAVVPLRRAVELAPEVAEAHNNLGTVLQAVCQFDEAGRAYDEALRLDPDLADAHFSRATFRLRAGDLAGGFEEYEWRWKCATFSDRGFAQPRWHGEPLAGRTILLYGEQGLGDMLHFVRLAAEAKRRGGRVIVECHQPLLQILASCPGIDQLIPFNTPLPPFDTHAPLMSLPGILQLTEDQFWQGAYLSADAALVDLWRERLAQYPGFRVGICWQGNPQHLFNAQRSLPAEALAPLARVPGVRLISLQKGAAIDALGADFEIIDLGPALDAQAGAFMDTAAVIRNLDLVVTVDTAIAHLAGALAAPTWLALSAHPDWRWMADREDTPWYATLRLFRQSRLDEWRDVIERMAAALAASATKH
ncbi:MAG: tetratricopeptide repeat protein [Pirellulales bacterium]